MHAENTTLQRRKAAVLSFGREKKINVTNLVRKLRHLFFVD